MSALELILLEVKHPVGHPECTSYFYLIGHIKISNGALIVHFTNAISHVPFEKKFETTGAFLCLKTQCVHICNVTSSMRKYEDMLVIMLFQVGTET